MTVYATSADPEWETRDFNRKCVHLTLAAIEMDEQVDTKGTRIQRLCSEAARLYYPGELSSVALSYCDEHRDAYLRANQRRQDRQDLIAIQRIVDTYRLGLEL